MKIKQYIASIALIICINMPIYSQKIVDIQADLFQLDKDGIKFYKKSSIGGYYDIDFELNRISDYEYYISVYSNWVDSTDISQTVLPVSALENFTPKNLEKKFVYHQYDQYFIQQLSSFSSTYFAERRYRYEYIYNEGLSEQQWVRQSTVYYNFFILRINNDKRLYILLENDDNFKSIDIIGAIGKTKSKIIANVDWGFYIQDNKSSKAIEKSETKNFGYNQPKDKIYRVTTNHELKDFVFNQSLKNEKFDTLYQEDNFIIGLKNKQYKIYNQKLESIEPPNTRSVHPTTDYGCQVLVDNKVKWLTESGDLSNEPKKYEFFVCGTVTTINKEIKIGKNSFQILKSIDAFDDKEPEEQLFTFSKVNFDDVWFLNGTKTLSHDGNSGLNASYSLPFKAYNLLILESANKFGLASYSEKNSKLDIIESPKYDSIIFNSYYHPILLKKDNLYGYFLLNRGMRYKSISNFNYSFARFTLPNGKEGWLDITGKEYLDK